jgi:TonB family protein
MVRLSIVGALVFALLPAVAAQQPAQTDPWPPVGAYLIGNGVTAPRLIHDVKPAYTGDTMRARIQGVIELACVVETDGSVGPVRMVRSLDAGLDEEAIKALKQWRFAPGMKDNVPVRVVVTVNLTFALSDDRYAPPPVAPGSTPAPAPALSWPEGFDRTTTREADQTAWTETTTEASGLLIKIGYPTDWTLRRNVTPTQLLVINNGDGTRSVTVMPPKPAPFNIDGAATSSESLNRLSQGIRSGAVFDSKKAELVASGQTQTTGRSWVWVDLRTNTSAIPYDEVRNLFETIRLWTFVTTAGGQMVTATCIAAVPRAANQAERDAQLQQAAADFGGIMRRLTVASR